MKTWDDLIWAQLKIYENDLKILQMLRNEAKKRGFILEDWIEKIIKEIPSEEGK